MSGKIKILSESISQAIAAGEVVERPGSVVKELMENAVDAGSSEIIVELNGGGLQCIRVQDNGEGMDREDVSLAIQRYATSKLKTAEDLYGIQTLGFRGEALPSIASVSQMTIKTRTSNSISGTILICEGGEIKRMAEVGCPIGTEIEVNHLFYNIPVKRKFLKSIRTELHHALNHFLRLSLSHPFISFRLIHDGHVLYEHVRAEDPWVRIEAILGREIYPHLQRFEFKDRDITLSGFASRPTFSKGTADGIYVYVNRRFIKDRAIHKAILEAYRHVIPAGKFPVVILFIHLPPSAVDVNIHPTKAEVKFKDQEEVFHAVRGTLCSIHQPIPWTADTKIQDQKQNEVYSKDSMLSSRNEKPYSSVSLWEQGGNAKETPMVKESLSSEWKGAKDHSLRILGQVQGTYILCEGEGGVFFIDQHAAHERILFEKYKEQFEAGTLPSEKFLIPVPIELSVTESFILESYLEEFQAMGIDIDPMGDKTYAIRSLPSMMDPRNVKEVLKGLLDELSFLKRERRRIEPIETLLVTLACHAAIRGNFILRREEMEELVKHLTPFNVTTTCPHGRPIYFVIKEGELAKQFKRNRRGPLS
jgi:DNA mismatch repair protein MutL